MGRESSTFDPTMLLPLDGGGIIGTVTAPGSPWPRTGETAIAVAGRLGLRLGIIDVPHGSGSGSRRRRAHREEDWARSIRRTMLMEPDELRRLGRKHLATCIDEARAQGVQSGGWLARGAGPRALEKFARRFPCHALVLPQTVGWSLRARLRGDAPAALRRLAERLTLLLVDEETGGVRLAGRAGPALPPAQTAYVLVQTTVEQRPIAPLLRGVPGVLAAHDIRGPYDALALARSDLHGGALQRVLAEIRSVPGVIRALAAPVVHSPIERSDIPSRSNEPPTDQEHPGSFTCSASVGTASPAMSDAAMPRASQATPDAITASRGALSRT